MKKYTLTPRGQEILGDVTQATLTEIVDMLDYHVSVSEFEDYDLIVDPSGLYLTASNERGIVVDDVCIATAEEN